MDETIYEQFTHLDEGLSGHEVTVMALSSTATGVVSRRNSVSYCTRVWSDSGFMDLILVPNR